MIDETDWGAVCAKEHKRALAMVKDAEISEQAALKLRDKFDADVKLTLIVGDAEDSRTSLYLELPDSDAVLKHVNALDSILQPLAVLRFYNSTKIGELEKLRKQQMEKARRLPVSVSIPDEITVGRVETNDLMTNPYRDQNRSRWRCSRRNSCLTAWGNNRIRACPAFRPAPPPQRSDARGGTEGSRNQRIWNT